MDTKVVEKIQKLLALSKSSNKHESHVALMKAQELLAKHKLTMKEIEEHQPVDIKIETGRTDVTFIKAKWKGQIGHLIANNFGCRMYFSTTNRSHRIVFLGKDEDVAVCVMVYEYAIDSIESATKRIKGRMIRAKKSTAGVDADYAIGFCNGLSQRFNEQKEKNTEWGLILVRDPAVDKAFDMIKFRKRLITTNVKFTGNNEAYKEGVKEGRRFSISDRIAENEENETLMLEQGG